MRILAAVPGYAEIVEPVSDRSISLSPVAWGLGALLAAAVAVVVLSLASADRADAALLPEPVTDIVSGVTGSVVTSPSTTGPESPVVTPTLAPVVDPVVQTVTPVVDPVVQAITPVLDPVVQTVTPVLDPVVQAVVPVVDSVLAPVVQTVVPVVDPVLGPVVQTLAPVLGPVVQTVLAPVVAPLDDALGNVLGNTVNGLGMGPLGVASPPTRDGGRSPTASLPGYDDGALPPVTGPELLPGATETGARSAPHATVTNRAPEPVLPPAPARAPAPPRPTTPVGSTTPSSALDTTRTLQLLLVAVAATLAALTLPRGRRVLPFGAVKPRLAFVSSIERPG